MSFLQDLGGFIKEVNSITEEIDDVKHDVVSSLVDSATQIGQTLGDAKSQVADAANDVTSIIHQASNDVAQSAQSSDDA